MLSYPWHFRDMTHPILAFNLVFIGKWLIYNPLLMPSTYTTLNNKRFPPYDTKLGSKESLVLEPRWTPSSTPISTISNSLPLFHSCQHAQAPNAQIHMLDDSKEMEVSTLASQPLHTWDWEHVSSTLQALSFAEKAEPVWVASHYAWGTNGVCECKIDVKVYMDSYMASNGSCFMVAWFVLETTSWCSRHNTNLEDHGTPNTHNRWFILFYHVWGPAWIEIHSNSIWLRVRSHMTSHYTWGPVTTLHDFGGVLGWPSTLSLGSHDFMVTALGSCVKWPSSTLRHFYLMCWIWHEPCGGLWIRPTHHTSLCYGREKWAKSVHKLIKSNVKYIESSLRLARRYEIV